MKQRYEPQRGTTSGKQPAGLHSPVTLFKSAQTTTNGKVTTLGELLKGMKDAKRKPQSEALRAAKEGDAIEYKKLKDSLPGFCLGEFTQRKDDSCTRYVPLLSFDVDAAGSGFLSLDTLEKAKKCPFVFAAFLTVSGQGVRILMRCNSTLETHKKYYSAGLKVLSSVLEIPTSKDLSDALKAAGNSPSEVAELLKQNEHLDCSTSNVSRLWYFSYLAEEELYLNEDSQVLQLEVTEPEDSGRGLSITDKIKLCRDKVGRQAIDSGRNNFVFALACEFAKFGLTKEEALAECLTHVEPDFTASEVNASVESAYKSKGPEYTEKQIESYQRLVTGTTNLPKATGHRAPKEPEAGASQTVNPDVKQSKFVAIRSYIKKTYDLRLNIISHSIEVSRKGKNEWEELNEKDLMCELMELGFNGVESMTLMLIGSSFVTRYDPLNEYFTKLPPWSDTEPDYIEQLASYVVAKDQDWFNLMFKKMLVRAVACALGIIPFNKQCFVIKSKQNDGKSSFVRFLCPPELREYMTDHLDIESKDGRLALCQNFIINLDELQGLSRAEINKTKALFTTDKVKERLPYDKKPTNHTRRASFFASTNEDEILIDATGNVRWLVLEVEKILHDNGGPNGYNKNVTIANVYRQAYYLLQNKYPFNLTKAEIEKSEDNNKAYQVSSSESDLIPQYFSPAEKDAPGAVFVTATDILDKLQEGRKTTFNRVLVGKALAFLEFTKSTNRVNGKPVKGYWVTETT